MKSILLGILSLFLGIHHILAQNEEFVLSPVPPYDTLYKTERIANINEFSFAGFVKTYSGQIIPSKVTLINTETSAEYSTNTTNTNNAFTITGLPLGNYILRADPSYFPYITTYFNETTFQPNAYVFVIDGNIRNVQLYLKEQPITATTDIKANSEVEIFPNPFDQNLTIKNFSNNKIEIFNLSGQLIASTTSTSQQIDTSLWERGIYLIKLQNGTVLKFTKV